MHRLVQISLAATITAGSLALTTGSAHAMNKQGRPPSPSRAQKQMKTMESLDRQIQELMQRRQIVEQAMAPKTQEQIERELQGLEAWKRPEGYKTEAQHRETARVRTEASTVQLQIPRINSELKSRGSHLRLRTDGVRAWDPHYFTGNVYKTLLSALRRIIDTGIEPYREGVAYGRRKYSTADERKQFREEHQQSGEELPHVINPEIHKYLVPMDQQIGYVGGDRESPSQILAIHTEESGLITSVMPTDDLAWRLHERRLVAQAAAASTQQGRNS